MHCLQTPRAISRLHFLCLRFVNSTNRSSAANIFCISTMAAANSTDVPASATRPHMIMPPMLYGTAWKAERTADLVERALTLGFRGIDTACQPKHYNEVGVGEGIQRWIQATSATLATTTAASSSSPSSSSPTSTRSRDQLFLQTKFTPISGQDTSKPLPYDPRAALADQVAQSFATSQKQLRSQFIDSLVLHSPLQRKTDLSSVWKAMEALVKAGSVGQIGISNCYDADLLRWLYDQASVKPSVVQNRLYADSGFDVEIRAFCKENNIRYQSFWTLTANPKILASPTVVALAKQHNVTPAMVFFRALVQLGITPLTGTTSEAHMRDDLNVQKFQLDEASVQKIDAMLR